LTAVLLGSRILKYIGLRINHFSSREIFQDE
jgi:hypothetical protein